MPGIHMRGKGRVCYSPTFFLLPSVFRPTGSGMLRNDSYLISMYLLYGFFTGLRPVSNRSPIFY